MGTHHGGIDKGVLKVGVAVEQLPVQECGVFDVAEEGEVDRVRGREVLEGHRLERHGFSRY